MKPFLNWLDIHKEDVARSIGPAAYEQTYKKGLPGFYPCQPKGLMSFSGLIAKMKS